MGLTAAQFRDKATGNVFNVAALAQDPRQTVRQQQAGVVLQHRLSPSTELSARLYSGTRDLANALSIPRPSAAELLNLPEPTAGARFSWRTRWRWTNAGNSASRSALRSIA